MTRYKAFSIHFLISVLIIGSFLTWAFFIWYGQIYLDISGVMDPAKMLIGIDVLLGPLLTLLVFKSGKKHLKMDLMLIVALQMGAFLYGAYTLYLGKPALVVLNDDVFEIITQKNIEPELNQKLKNKMGVLAAPHYAAIDPNKVIKQQPALMQQAFLTPIELNESWVESKQVPIEVVLRQLKVTDSELNQMLINDDLSNQQYYVMSDTYLNAVLVVKNNTPVKVIHSVKL